MIRPTSFAKIYRPIPLSKSTQAQAAQKMSMAVAAACADPGADRIQISAQGSFQSALAEAVHTVGREISSSVPEERLAQLKEQMASGSYQVSSSALAETMAQRAGASWEV